MQIQNPMMFVRSLKGAPASMLWVLIIVRQALTVNQLCAYTGFKADAIRDAARVLQGYELAVENKRSHGEATYSLGEGYQALLPGIDPVALARVGGMADPESDLNQLWPQKAEENEPVEEIQNRIKSDSETKNPQNSNQNRIKTDSETGSIKIIKTLIHDDDDFKFNLNSSSSSVMNPKRFEEPIPAEKRVDRTEEHEEIIYFDVEQKPPFPSVKTLLENIDMLFGDTLDLELFDENLSPKLALAWIIKLYLDKKNNPTGFRNPLGTLRLRLEAHAPRKISRLEEMPDSFLEAIGLWEGQCSFCQTGFYSRAALNEHLLSGHGDQDDDDSLPVPAAMVEEFEIDPDFDPAAILDGKGISIGQAWKRVLNELQQEMPKASFDTWVRETRPVGWESGILRIGTRNKYARDWLADRLGNVITGLVTNLLADRQGDITVEFVIARAE